MNQSLKPLLRFGLCALLLAGCQTGGVDNSASVLVPAKGRWSGGAANAELAAATIAPNWWAEFGDVQLDELMARALASNVDIEIALGRVLESQAALGEVRGLRQPTARASLNTPVRTARDPRTGSLETTTSYSGQLDINWELDVWGRLKKGVEAQQSAFRASEADWRATYLNTASQLATTYFQVRQLDSQLAIQQGSLAGAEQSLAIFIAQEREGLVGAREVLRQRAELNSRRRTLIDLQRQREITVNALATLLGEPAGQFDLAPASNALETSDILVPAGLPSELLRRRPDVLAAEYRVLEAHQLVGQARLARLPAVRLTANSQGGGELASAALNSFLKSVSFGLTPNVSFPLFDPAVKARLRSSTARTKTVEAQYRRTVLIAFQEVENALVNLDARRAQRTELVAERASLQRVANQVQKQLEAGIASQLDVFEAQRRLLEVSQATLNNRQQIISETITLYKALGGGWMPNPLESAR